MATSSAFKLSNKNVFLTYPKCNISPSELNAFLQNKCSRYRPYFVASVTESHQDGTLHLHCFIQCDLRIQTRQATFFDYYCPEQRKGFHPNIQSVRDCRAVLDYISKDSPPTTWGEFRHERPLKDTKDNIMNDIISTATSKTESPISPPEVFFHSDLTPNLLKNLFM